VLVVLGLLAAMLAVVVVPLGLITAQHYRQDFQEQAIDRNWGCPS
jgi:hypothetical protein